MSADDQKSKNSAAKKPNAAENNTAETPPKGEAVKTEGGQNDAAKPGAAPSRQGMGEGQKRVSQAYKDNWNAIFAKKKKRR